ncbi:MAG: hypothetical protein K2N15_10805 [Lachnospiraceae bacterium]|nr:hypothetical protein [Lachnospiraceae bacterium]
MLLSIWNGDETMGTEIDRLDMKIEAEASDANKQLEETVSRLKEILAPLNDIMNHKAFVQLKQQSKEIDKSLTRISKETKAAMQGVSASMEKATKPMEKAVKDVSKMMSELNEKYKDLGKDFQFFGSGESAKKQIEKYSNALEIAKLKKAELEATGKTEGQMYEYAIRDVQKYSNILANLKNQYPEGPVVEYADISEMTQDEFDEWMKTLPSVKAQAQGISDTIEEIGERAREVTREFLGQWNGVEIPDLSGKTDLSSMTKRELDDWFNNLPSVKAQAEQAMQSIKDSFEQIEEPLKEIDMTLADLASSVEQTFTAPETKANRFSKMLEQMKEIAGEIANRFAEMKGRMENAFVRSGLKSYTSQYTELQNEITKTEKTLATLNAQLARSRETVKNFDKTTAYRKMQYDIAGAKKELQRLREEQDKLETSGGATQWNFKGLSEGLQNFKKALQPLGTTLKNLDKRITAFVKKLRSIIFPARNAKKSVDGFHKSLSGGLGTILKYSFGIRSLFVLFNRMRSAATEGFKNLVLYSDKVNASISLLMNSANQLKNSFAAMVAPILNAVAPALNYLMQLCVKAANSVNQLISALLGNDTWIRAKKLTQDYRDTIQGVKDDVEEVTKTILGFDQLNVLNGKNEKADSDTGNLLPEDMFETLPVESKFKDLADKIKGILSQFFAPLKEAWNREGKFVMDSWKYALDEIWALIKSIGSDFLEVWQQEKTIKIFGDILHIIGDIGLVVGNLDHNFREAWEGNETGKKILEGIRDIIGVIVANIRHAADATVEWSANLDFSPLLTKIQAWVESLVPVFDNLSGIVTDFYEKVLLPLGKWTIEKGLPDLVQVFIDFNEKVDWEALRARLSEFWKHLEPFAETVGEGLILFIEKVSNALADFINSPQFDDFLTSIENWMDNVKPEDVADALEKIAEAIIVLKGGLKLWGVLETPIKLFGSFASIISNAKLAKALKNLGGASGGASVIKKLGEALSLWKGGAGTLSESLSTMFPTAAKIVSWIPHAAVAAAIVGVGNEIKKQMQNLFDTEDWGIGDWIVNTLKTSLSGWKSEFDNFKISLELWWQDTWMSDAIWKFGQWWDEKIAPWFTQERWAELWENIKSSASEKWNAFLEWWNSSTLVVWWQNNVSPWFTQEKWSELWNNVKNAFLNKWQEIKDWWSNTAIVGWWNDNVKPWFTLEKWAELYDSIKTSLKSKWDETVGQWKTDISSWWNESVVPWFTAEKWLGIFNSIKKSLKNVWNDTAGQWLSDITTWWSNDVQPWFTLEKWKNLLSKIPTAFSDAFNAAKEKALGVVEELYNKIVGWVEKMIEKIEKVIAKAKEAIGLGSSSSSSSSSSSVGKRSTSSSGKLSVNIPKITIPTIKVPTISVNIPKFATGGFPEDGLFMANHGELLGKFANGRTAVANNEQITTGIENAVYRAMMSVMQSGAFGNNGNIMVNAVLKTENDEVLARAVTRGQEKIDRRYKPSMP